MIYRALTPVANVSCEGTGRPTLWADSVDQTMFTTRTKWVFDFLFPDWSVSSKGIKITYYSWTVKRLVKTTSSWIFSAFTVTMPSGGKGDFNWMSLSILVVHKFHAPIRQGLSTSRQAKQQTKLRTLKVLYVTKWGWLGSPSCEV